MCTKHSQIFAVFIVKRFYVRAHNLPNHFGARCMRDTNHHRLHAVPNVQLEVVSSEYVVYEMRNTKAHFVDCLVSLQHSPMVN